MLTHRHWVSNFIISMMSTKYIVEEKPVRAFKLLPLKILLHFFTKTWVSLRHSLIHNFVLIAFWIPHSIFVLLLLDQNNTHQFAFLVMLNYVEIDKSQNIGFLNLKILCDKDIFKWTRIERSNNIQNHINVEFLFTSFQKYY